MNASRLQRLQNGLMKLFAAVVGMFGAVFVLCGAYLAFLGGSPYYLLDGLILLAAATMLWRRQRVGAWAFGLALALTLGWAVAEVDFDGWSLMPRILIPLALGLWLLMPWSQKALTGRSPANQHLARSVTLILGGSALAILLGHAVYTIQSPSRPTDPRFQTGVGAFPQIATGSYQGAAGDDWPMFSGDQGGSRYSPLGDINPANVDKLQIAWTADVGKIPFTNASPIKIGDTIYTCDNQSKLFALNAANGAQRWSYDTGRYGHAGACRGVTYFAGPDKAAPCGERIISATFNAELIAVDARSGRLCRDFGQGGIVDLTIGMNDVDGKLIKGYYRVSSPPTLVRGKLVIGGWVTDGQFWGESSGVIRAFDAVTGKLAWAWDMGRPDRIGAPPPGESYTVATPNSWAPSSADEELGLVYLPLGNATPDFFGGQRRPFDNKYSSSVVALDAETGRPRWSFQTVHHDLWDYDVASPPALIDLPGSDGKIRKALIQPTKSGELYVLDRTTGQPIFPVTEMPVSRAGAVPEERPSPTQPFSNALPSFRGAKLREADMWGISPFDQLYCRIQFRQARYEGIYTPPGLTPSIMSPSSFGAMNWGGVALDPVHAVMIVNSNRFTSYVRLITRDQAKARGLKRAGDYHDPREVGGAVAQENVPYAAAPHFWMTGLNVPCISPPFGLLSAVDLHTGKLLWTRRLGTSRGSGPLSIPLPLDLPMGTPTHGGSLITAGGLVFTGATKDNYFQAYDIRTGERVWRVSLPGGGSSAPMSYRLGGRQYIVIQAGGQPAIESRPSTKMVAFVLPREASMGGSSAVH